MWREPHWRIFNKLIYTYVLPATKLFGSIKKEAGSSPLGPADTRLSSIVLLFVSITTSVSVSIEISSCFDLHILALFEPDDGILKASDVGVSCDTVTVTGLELGIQSELSVPV